MLLSLSSVVYDGSVLYSRPSFWRRCRKRNHVQRVVRSAYNRESPIEERQVGTDHAENT
jgi:hypothetical protein